MLFREVPKQHHLSALSHPEIKDVLVKDDCAGLIMGKVICDNLGAGKYAVQEHVSEREFILSYQSLNQLFLVKGLNHIHKTLILFKNSGINFNMPAEEKSKLVSSLIGSRVLIQDAHRKYSLIYGDLLEIINGKKYKVLDLNSVGVLNNSLQYLSHLFIEKKYRLVKN